MLLMPATANRVVEQTRLANSSVARRALLRLHDDQFNTLSMNVSNFRLGHFPLRRSHLALYPLPPAIKSVSIVGVLLQDLIQL